MFEAGKHDRRAVLDALIRTNFFAFLCKVFETLHGGTHLKENWHLLAMAYEASLILSGEETRLIVELPPRYLKSETFSIALPCFALGQNPTLRIICACYGDDLSRKFSRDRQKIMSAKWFKDAFPNTRLQRGKASEVEFETTRGGGCFATSVGGALTGRGADLLIIDDPIKTDQARSKAERDAVSRWYSESAYSRLNDKAESKVIIVMQRTHQDDLSGYVRPLDDWRILTLPAVADEDESYAIGEGELHHRKAGEVLHPARESAETLERTKANLTPHAYSAQYQQAPVPEAGNLIQKEWLRYFPQQKSRGDFDEIIQSWDTASSTGTSSAYSVCTTWGIATDGYYLLDVFRKRMDFPSLLEAVETQAENERPQAILVEDASSGTQICQMLQGKKHLKLVRQPRPKQDKTARLEQVSPEFASGKVCFKEDAIWLADLENELLSFPDSRFTDQVDSITQFLLYITNRKSRKHKSVMAGGPASRQKSKVHFPRPVYCPKDTPPERNGRHPLAKTYRMHR